MTDRLDMTPTPSLPCICDLLDSDGYYHSRPLRGYLQVAERPQVHMYFISDDCPQHGGYVESRSALELVKMSQGSPSLLRADMGTNRKRFLEKLPWLLPDVEGAMTLQYDPKLVPPSPGVTAFITEYVSDSEGRIRDPYTSEIVKHLMHVKAEPDRTVRIAERTGESIGSDGWSALAL
jgi:hypothetical protein